MRRSVAAVLVLATGMLISASGAAPAQQGARLSSPRALLVEKGKIYKFAQDRTTIAWVGPKYWLHVQQLSTHKTWHLGHLEPSVRAGYRSGPRALVVEGKRVAWMNYGGVMTHEAAISTRAPGEPKATLVDAYGYADATNEGMYFGGLAADANTLAYGDAAVYCQPKYRCFSDRQEYVVSGGGVHRSTGLKTYPQRIQGIPAPVAIALSEGRLAVIPADTSASTTAAPHPASNGPVGVYDLAGRPVTTVVPVGTAREVALAWPTLAVLVQQRDGATAIERYDARNGALIDRTQAAGASQLAIGSGGTVFLVGSTIYTLRSGLAQILWRPQGKPIGLSVEGRRVAWAVNIGERGRIVTLELPRSP